MDKIYKTIRWSKETILKSIQMQNKQYSDTKLYKRKCTGASYTKAKEKSTRLDWFIRPHLDWLYKRGGGFL